MLKTYTTPLCEELETRIESTILETSFKSGSIEDGTLVDPWTL